MKQTINFAEFVDGFVRANRFEQFGYDALKLIFDHFEELEESTGEEIEFDVIAICCDIAAEDWLTLAEYYSIDLTECYTDEEKMEAVAEYMENATTVIGQTDDQIVYFQF